MMKRIVTFILVGIMILSGTDVFAEEQLGKLPDILKLGNERYADSIAEAIEKSNFDDAQIDQDNIFIVEKKNTLIFDGGIDYNQYYVALPSLKTDDIRFASFYKGEYQSESMNTLSWIDQIETHQNTKIEEYIKNNKLENVAEAVSVVFSVSGGTSAARASVNAYKIITSNNTYYIPYYVDGIFNPANDKNCSLELCKAYTEDEFATLTKAETQSYLDYKDAERLAAEAAEEEEKYRPTVSLDENGEEIIKVNGTNLDDILNHLIDNINLMGFGSTIKLGINTPNDNDMVTYRWQSGCDVDAVANFAEGLFDELKTQVTTGKPDALQNASYCNFALRHDEGYTSVRHQTEISVWNDGVKITSTSNGNDAIEFKVKNSDAIINYLSRYDHDRFNGFSYEKNNEETPHIKSSIDGFIKTDMIEFDFELPADSDNSIAKEVASPSSTVNGIFVRYRENTYRSAYILTLSGNLGAISLCKESQSSLSGEEEFFSNNVPISFLNTLRYEDGNIVEYEIGKESTLYDLKMVFQSNDISELYFDGTKCTNLKYTQLTEDTKLSDEYTEKDKETSIRKAEECADTLYDFGLFKGTDKGYELEKSLTREESATILVRLLGKEGKINADDFDEVFIDVNRDRWSYVYVMYCYENDITKGTGKDTFSPDVEIDADQFITLLLRLLGYTEVNPDTAMMKSVEYQLLPADKAEDFAQKTVFTRSDMVQVVYNSLKTKMSDGTVFADYLLSKGILTETEVGQIKE